MRWPEFDAWLFSVKTFAGAMLALYIGFGSACDRPYWAMASAYIASQPLSGATRSKASTGSAARCSARAAVVLVPNLVDAPVLLSLALALWIGGCLYFALLDRTPAQLRLHAGRLHRRDHRLSRRRRPGRDLRHRAGPGARRSASASSAPAWWPASCFPAPGRHRCWRPASTPGSATPARWSLDALAGGRRTRRRGGAPAPRRRRRRDRPARHPPGLRHVGQPRDAPRSCGRCARAC